MKKLVLIVGFIGVTMLYAPSMQALNEEVLGATPEFEEANEKVLGAIPEFEEALEFAGDLQPGFNVERAVELAQKLANRNESILDAQEQEDLYEIIEEAKLLKNQFAQKLRYGQLNAEDFRKLRAIGYMLNDAPYSAIFFY